MICFIFVENPIVVDELAESGSENNPIIISDDDDEDEPVRQPALRWHQPRPMAIGMYNIIFILFISLFIAVTPTVKSAEE